MSLAGRAGRPVRRSLGEGACPPRRAPSARPAAPHLTRISTDISTRRVLPAPEARYLCRIALQQNPKPHRGGIFYLGESAGLQGGEEAAPGRSLRPFFHWVLQGFRAYGARRRPVCKYALLSACKVQLCGPRLTHNVTEASPPASRPDISRLFPVHYGDYIIRQCLILRPLQKSLIAAHFAVDNPGLTAKV
jgi:hypothetical protein